MLIGVPKEIKNHEYRIGLVPSSVAELVHHGARGACRTWRWSRRGVAG